jgi:hypothetical protein
VWNSIRIGFAFFWLAWNAPSAFPQIGRLSDQDVLQRGTNPQWVDVQEQEVQFGASPLSRDNLVSRDGWTQNESSNSFWSWLFGNNSTRSPNIGSTTTNSTGTSWANFWEAVSTFFSYLLWITPAIGALWLVVWLLKNQGLATRFNRRTKTPRRTEDVLAQQARYSDLPVEIEKGLLGLRAQAAEYRDQGDYSRAIVFLFSYLLVELDQAQLIALAKGKTNYRYLRELNPHHHLQSRLRDVVSLFEAAYFGRRTLTKEQFDTVWLDLAKVEESIKNSPNRQTQPLVGSALLALVVLGIPSLGGCKSDLSDAYGTSESQSAEASPGGMSVLREMVKAHDLPTETLASLSPSMEEKYQTIIWTPNYFPFHTRANLDCLDRWLRTGGKTLVYVGRDYSPHADYWDRVASNPNSDLDPTQRARGLIQGAIASSLLDSLRDSQRELLVTPWFSWRHVPGPFRKVKRFLGEWADDPSIANSRIQVRSSLDPFDRLELDALRKELDWSSTAVPPAPAAAPATSKPKRKATQNPSQPGTTPPPPRKTDRMFQFPTIRGPNTDLKIWNTDDEELLAIADGIHAIDYDTVRVLLAADDGTPLVSELRYTSSLSRVLILSNSSIVSNLGLLDAGNRRLTDRLIESFSEGRVGFLSGDEEPAIRQGTSQEDFKGFEMLTVWPFNVMTIHAALVAMVAIIAAFPIFGRPKSSPRVSTANFGEHVESVGDLLRATNGREYAIDSISKYFRIVRGDQKTQWVHRNSLDPPSDPPSSGSSSSESESSESESSDSKSGGSKTDP